MKSCRWDVILAAVGGLYAAINATPVLAQVARWRANSPESDRVLVDGVVVKSLTANGLTFFVSIRDTGWKTRCDLLIRNSNGQRFDVFPQQFMLEVTAPAPRPLAYEAPDALVRSIRRSSALVAALQAISGALASKTTTTQTEYSAPGRYGIRTIGHSTGTATGPDDFARAVAYENTQAVAQNRDAAIAYLERTSLKANTLMPGTELAGAVFFERAKDAGSVLVRVNLRGTAFEIPYELEDPAAAVMDSARLAVMQSTARQPLLLTIRPGVKVYATEPRSKVIETFLATGIRLSLDHREGGWFKVTWDSGDGLKSGFVYASDTRLVMPGSPPPAPDTATPAVELDSSPRPAGVLAQADKAVESGLQPQVVETLLPDAPVYESANADSPVVATFPAAAMRLTVVRRVGIWLRVRWTANDRTSMGYVLAGDVQPLTGNGSRP